MAGAPDSEGRGGCRMWDRRARTSGRLSGEALLCDWCLEVAERDVRALVWDYVGLAQILAPALGVWGDGMPRGKSSPLPLREHVRVLQEDIHWLTDAWCEVACDIHRLPARPQDVREGWAVQQSVSILAPRLHVLATARPRPFTTYPGIEGECVDVPGWRGVLDLARLHHRARSALGLTSPTREHCQGVSCRDCDVQYLFRIPGEDGVRCEACGLYYTAEQYADWVALLAAHAGAA